MSNTMSNPANADPSFFDEKGDPAACPFKLLRVWATDPPEEIQRAYRRACSLEHNQADKSLAAVKIQKLTDAYNFLTSEKYKCKKQVYIAEQLNEAWERLETLQNRNGILQKQKDRQAAELKNLKEERDDALKKVTDLEDAQKILLEIKEDQYKLVGSLQAAAKQKEEQHRDNVEKLHTEYKSKIEGCLKQMAELRQEHSSAIQVLKSEAETLQCSHLAEVAKLKNQHDELVERMTSKHNSSVEKLNGEVSSLKEAQASAITESKKIQSQHELVVEGYKQQVAELDQKFESTVKIYKRELFDLKQRHDEEAQREKLEHNLLLEKLNKEICSLKEAQASAITKSKQMQSQHESVIDYYKKRVAELDDKLQSTVKLFEKDALELKKQHDEKVERMTSEHNSGVHQLNEEIYSLKEAHVSTINEFKKVQSQHELMVGGYKKRVAELNNKFESESLELKKQHDKKIEHMTSEHNLSVEKLKGEVSCLKKAHASAINELRSEHELMVGGYKKQVAELDGRYESTIQLFEKELFESEAATLRSKISDIKSNHELGEKEHIKQVTHMQSKRKSTVDKLIKEISSLKQIHASAVNEAKRQHKHQCDQIEAMQVEHKAEIAKLRSALSVAHESALNDLENKINELEVKAKSDGSKIKELELEHNTQIKRLESEHKSQTDAFDRQIATLKEMQAKSLNEINAAQHKHKSDISELKNRQKKTIEKFQSDHKRKIDKTNESTRVLTEALQHGLRDTKKNYASDIAELKQQHDTQVKSMGTQYQSTIESLTNEIKDLKQLQKSAAEELKSSVGTSIRLQKQITALEHEHKLKVEQHDAQVKSMRLQYESTTERLTNEIQDLKQSRKAAAEELKSSVDASNELQKQITAMEQEHKSEAERHDSQVKSMKTQYETTIERLTNQIKDLKQLQKSAAEELKSCVDASNELRKQITALEQEHRTELDRLNSTLSKAHSSAVDALKSKIKEEATDEKNDNHNVIKYRRKTGAQDTPLLRRRRLSITNSEVPDCADPFAHLGRLGNTSRSNGKMKSVDGCIKVGRDAREIGGWKSMVKTLKKSTAYTTFKRPIECIDFTIDDFKIKPSPKKAKNS
jgi:chromosome segregation ATPase